MLMPVSVVVDPIGHWTVTNELGETMYVQSEFDKASIAVDSGHVKAPRDWDGLPITLPAWDSFDPEAITHISDDYAPLFEEGVIA